MRKLLFVVAALVAMVLGTAGPAAAITGGWVPDSEHPFVGLVVFYDENGEFLHRCSGSLSTPDRVPHRRPLHRRRDRRDDAPHLLPAGRRRQLRPGDRVDPITATRRLRPRHARTVRTSDQLYNYGFDDFAGFPNTQDAGS